MKKLFYIIIVFTLILCTCFSSFGSSWDWTEGFFDVDDKFTGEDNFDETSSKTEDNQKESYKITVENDNSSLVKSSAPAANYTLNPSNVKWYGLSEQGFTAQYDLVCNILSGNESTYTMLACALSNTTLNFYICEEGIPFTYETFSNNTYTPSRFAYGYLGSVSNSFVPKFYSFAYNASTETFTDRLVNTQSSSTFGYNFGSLTGDNYYCYSIFSFNLTNFISNVRDYYYFGSSPINTSLTGAVSGVRYLNQNDSSKVFRFKTPRIYAMGDALDNFPSISVLPDSGARPYFFGSSYSLSDFQIYNISEYEEDYSSIDDALIQFTTDTRAFITRINNSKYRVTGYISDFFTVFDSDHIPLPLYYILLFLVILAVLVGVFA